MLNSSTFSSTFYHATLLEHLDSIKEKVLIHRDNALINLDFGKGFYLTSNYKQAVERATYLQDLKRDTIKGTLRKEHRGIVIHFNLDLDLLYSVPEVNWKHFPSINEEWARYIYYNRVNRRSFDSQDYLWTYGPMADGYVGYACDKFTESDNVSEFISEIRPYGAGYDQLSFHNDEEFANHVLKYNRFDIVVNNPFIAQKR